MPKLKYTKNKTSLLKCLRKKILLGLTTRGHIIYIATDLFTLTYFYGSAGSFVACSVSANRDGEPGGVHKTIYHRLISSMSHSKTTIVLGLEK